jgi:hypothetical protein
MEDKNNIHAISTRLWENIAVLAKESDFKAYT